MRYKQNKKFIDPRYFMDEKTEVIKEVLKENVETFFRNVLGGNFNSVAGRADGGSVTWNLDHERSSPGSTTMRGVAATQDLGRKVAQGSEAGMQKLQQAISN